MVEYNTLWPLINNIWSIKNKSCLNGNSTIMTTTYNCCFNHTTHKSKDSKDLKNSGKRHIKVLHEKFTCNACLKAQFYAVSNEGDAY